MLVSAAYILEPEILLSARGKENLDLLQQRFWKSRPETLILLAKHGSWQEDQLSLDLSDNYVIMGRDFYPDFQTIETLQRELRKLDYPLTLDSHGQIHEHLAVFLSEAPNVRLLPLSWCNLGELLHEEIGEQMVDFIIDSPKRIAVLALKDDELCRSWLILQGMIKPIKMHGANIADQAIFYDS